MGKDLLGYRTSKKFALGSQDVERSIGITALRSVDPCSLSHAARRQLKYDPGHAEYDILHTRPTALMKWAFDDYLVEEIIPREALFSSSDDSGDASPPPPPPSGATTLVVPILSEGVPDTIVEHQLAQLCPRGVPFFFLTPVDYCSCAVRHVWVRGDSEALRATFSQPHVVRTSSGEIRFLPAQVCRVSSSATCFPLAWLPDLRYTVVLRNIISTLHDVLPHIKHLEQEGFLNYSHFARHGLGALRAYEDAKCLINRQYPLFLQHHVKSLTEGSSHLAKEIPFVLDLLMDTKSRQSDWRNAVHGLEGALRQAEAVMRLPQTGLYKPHHELLHDFVTRTADVMPRHHDSAQVIRETISRAVLHEKMRAVSEVHFNAMASLRWNAHGSRVVVGDLVLDGKEQYRGDIFEGAADHVNGTMTSGAHVDWVDAASAEEKDVFSEWHRQVRVVSSQADADQCDITQVVLPYWGRGCGDDDGTSMLLPSNDSGELFSSMARELRIEGLSAMRTASVASYRHLVRKPAEFGAYIFSQQHGWDWVEGGAYGESLKRRMYRDQEGIHRLRSPLMDATGRNMIARRGIRGEEFRHHFLKPARKDGLMCAVQLKMPRGSPVTSALREVFRFTTLSPEGIYRLLCHR